MEKDKEMQTETSFTKKRIGPEGKEPFVTPPTTSPETHLSRKPKLQGTQSKKKEIREGLWTKCPECGLLIYGKELEANLKVCLHCNHHFPLGARERIETLIDPDTFQELDAELSSVDILGFPGYTKKLAKNKKATGLHDAVVTGLGSIMGRRIAFAGMDFGFNGGSMGSVVGEKLARLIESGTENRLPVVIASTSGGARMYEGMFSLMQMAKTCGALAYHAKRKLPFISVLTDPTMAGVMASFASVGDLIIAEPGARIGFAGPRVIKDTTQAELPQGFQTSEFLCEHGLIDAIVPRKQMRTRLAAYLNFLS